MTDNDRLLSEIQHINETLGKHGAKLETLADAFSKMAVQNEQIVQLQIQTNALWKKMDELSGPGGEMTKIRDHQAQCPKDEMHRTFIWMWGAIGVQSAVMLGIMWKVVG